MRRESFIAAALAIVLLALGVFAGVILDRLWLAKDNDHPPPHGFRPPPPRPGHMLGILREELQLTDAQADKVRAILDDTQQKAAALFEKHEPEMRALMDASDDQIRAVLDAKQVERYQSFIKERRHRGPPPPPPM